MRTFLSRVLAGVRRNATAGVAIAALVVATAIAVPLTISASLQPANSNSASSSAHSAPKTPANPPAMGSYPTSKYVAAGKKLPAGLATALKRDVHLTPAQYLANSAAAVQGVKVVATLKSGGVHVLGSKMEGAKLIVNVASASDVAPVEALGASAVIGAPKANAFSHVKFQTAASSTTSTYGGQAYYFSDTPGGNSGEGSRCSIGFNGYSVSTGASEFVTAGHCEQAIPTSVPTSVYFLNYNVPASAGGSGQEIPTPLGAGVVGQFGSGDDYGIISTNTTSFSPQNSVATWGGTTTGAPLATAPLGVTGESAGIDNATLCKSGSTTGWTCGSIEGVDETATFGDLNVNAIIASTCILPGDSGSAALMGSTAVGIDSGGGFSTPPGTTPTSCSQEQYSVFFPMVSAAGNNSVQGQQGASWQLGVQVTSTPSVTSPSAGGTAYPGSVMTGTITNAVPGSDVFLYLDGSTTRFAKVDASSGSFRIPLAGVSVGAHTYSLVAGVGWSQSTTTTTGTFTRSSACPPAGTPSLVPAGGVGDFNCDGNSDVVVRDGNGTLFLYPGNGGTGFLPRVQLGAVGAWAGMTAIVAAGDLNGDGNPDIVGRDHAGTLWLYPGNGSNGFGTREQLGAAGAWLGTTAIQGVGDFNGDGHADLVVRDTSGNVLLYPGNGTSTNTLGAPITIATGWQGMTGIMGIGDFDGDGKADILARDAAGALWLYPGLGSATTAVSGGTGGGFAPRIQVGGGWQGITIQAIGDFNNDGHEDIFVRDANGALWLYPGTGNAASPFLARIQVGGGWQGLTIAGDAASIQAVTPPVPAAVSGGVGDFNGDGNSDVVVRDGNGTLWLYPGNGGTGFRTRVPLSAVGAWAGMTAIVAAGDLNGDGNPDIVARDSSGTLFLYPGNGSNGFGTREPLRATGEFAGMTAIQGVGDFNGDGHADLLARDGSGNLLLYPGNGTSTNTLGAPITIATGWGSFTGIMGIGDFDGDGKSDILARDAAGALWLYPGLGSATTPVSGATGGGFGQRIQVGGGWQGITIQAIGDFNNDGHEDIFVRDANGALWLYPGTGVASNPFLTRIQVGGGWQGLTIAGDASTIGATGS